MLNDQWEIPSEDLNRLIRTKSQPRYKGTNLSHPIIFDLLNEVISEKEALQYQPCQDENLAANASLSTLHLLESQSKVYHIGDKIHILATLFDSNGERKSTGGDQLRARILNPNLNASAPGVVLDYKNGTHLLIFDALWNGRALIIATIAYTREVITALYRVTSKALSLRIISAKFKVRNYEEITMCHPDRNHLLKCTNYKNVCNFTSLNSGMPWYCGKPQHPKLRCSDWKYVKCEHHEIPSSLLSECERKLIDTRCHQVFTNNVTITITELTQRKGENRVLYHQSNILCSKYNTTKLWFKRYTTGFFFQRRWHLTHCRGFERASFHECLKNKTLYLMGDSTIRQWYTYIIEQYNCTQFTEKWTDEKWKRPAACTVKSNNFTVYKTSHCHPRDFGPWTDPKFNLMSIPKQIEQIAPNENAIFVIHIFAHMRTIHYKYFRNKMIAIRESMEKVLERNNKVKFFLKMPHTFIAGREGNKDFFGYVYTHIIFETFKGLYDKVIALDNKDATISEASQDLHPEYDVVSSMVDTMFSYVC